MTKIVPNDLLTPTEKTIKNWNCSFIAVEGPNIIDKLSLEDLEIPYESQYRSRIILKAGETDQPLIYGFIGKAVTFLMVKATYDSINDPYYQYEQETYNITYYFENDPILRPLNRLLIMTGSADNKIPQIYLNNPLDYDVTLDILHATTDTEYSGATIAGFAMPDLSDVMFSGLTSGDTLQYMNGYWINVSGITGGGGTNGTSGSSGSSGVDGTFYGSSGSSGISGTNGTSGSSGVSGTLTGVTISSEFYYLTGSSALYVPNIVVTGLTLIGLASLSGFTNYVVIDSNGKVYSTNIGLTEDVVVARDGGGTITLHFLNGLYIGQT